MLKQTRLQQKRERKSAKRRRMKESGRRRTDPGTPKGFDRSVSKMNEGMQTLMKSLGNPFRR